MTVKITTKLKNDYNSMDNRYNIGQLFQVAFGTNLPVYLSVPIGKQPKTEVNYGSVQVVVVTIFQKFRNFAMSYNLYK